MIYSVRQPWTVFKWLYITGLAGQESDSYHFVPLALQELLSFAPRRALTSSGEDSEWQK